MHTKSSAVQSAAAVPPVSPARPGGARWPFALALLLATGANPAIAATGATHHFTADGQTYAYTTQPTGENFTFEFDRNPGSEKRQIRAAGAVFRTVYGDDSIALAAHETFMKEGARCFVFAARFHAYTACFLPNDYAPGQRDRFWGFVTRVPNAAWLITRNLLPALLALGAFFYSLRPNRRG